ncbi:MAG: hypothetical protein H7175_18275, partial [Burkholderiales bacterium]|nr:hypothetical protein [Anaerolineae bacterium]
MARRIADKPRLIFAAQVRRKPFFRRFMWSLLAIVAAFGALIVLDYVTGLNLADVTLLLIGKIVALVIMALFAIRGFANLWRAITYKSESMQFFNQGFVWRRDDKIHRYGWNKLAGFREGARTIRLFGRPFLQFGAQTLRMQDKREFNFLGRHGDARRFANVIRPYVAAVTGARMGRALRAENPIRLHKHLVLHPGGVEVGKQVILWSELDVQRNSRQLTIRRKNQAGKFKTVRRFDVHQIENI